MSIHYREFDYSQRDELADLIARLIEGRGQFSVCPFPQDLKDARRTGWAVSWPVERRVSVAQPAPAGDVA